MKGKKIKQTLLLACLLLIVSINQAYAKCSDKHAPGVDWSGCKKTNKMLDGSNFTGSRFDNANMTSSSLDKGNFTDASLIKTDLNRGSAKGARFYNSD